MLDLKYVCDNIESVKKALSTRSGKFPIDEVALLALKRKELIGKSEAMKAEKNKASEKIAALKKEKKDATDLIKDMQTIGAEIKKMDTELNETEAKIKELMLAIPNIPNPSIKVGKDSDDNREVRKFMTPTEFSFTPLAHWDIGENLGILSPRLAGKITGTRFTVYKGWGAKLERAVINFMLDSHAEEGYEEVFPPFMVNRDSMIGTGQLPKFEEDMFAIKNTDYYLIPTAEVPVTNLLRGEIIDKEKLPIYYCAYTACFRAEAGSAGRDTRGLIRQHQFNKVELVKFTLPENSYDELEKLTENAENILKKLKIPYRVVELCTGDLGFSSAKTYDIEVWMPSYGKYVEISSCSDFEDFQARRANIKFRDENKKTAFVHTLNGSGLAVGRTVAAILENYQNADGSVTVPEVLRKYIGTDIIK